MTLADLRPEQRYFVERVLYSVGRSPLDPIYAGLIAEVVAIYDEDKDRLLRMCEDQKPNQVLLFRGPNLYKRVGSRSDRHLMTREFGAIEVFLLHREPLRMSRDEPFDPAAVQHNWQERFILYGQSCKHCGALHYYSQNWQEMPEWARQAEYDSRYG